MHKRPWEFLPDSASVVHRETGLKVRVEPFGKGWVGTPVHIPQGLFEPTTKRRNGALTLLLIEAMQAYRHFLQRRKN